MDFESKTTLIDMLVFLKFISYHWYGSRLQVRGLEFVTVTPFSVLTDVRLHSLSFDTHGTSGFKIIK